ncbi:MAG: hypothetical protein A3F80_07920 [Candidatus Melainabacteria bacterium RIFCSPLOWO2_12_FULL_35_11]|nr:MAG: hypothetical protein A3F80_07920 [Candidatus Melainabacteria bacterium RIFCSPLOWO2_12_FULL_35_11]
MTYKKKLIEVAIPLEAINKEAVREKSIRHGHPSTLHLWWSRKPLSACRAILFAQLVDDPSSHPDKFPTQTDITKERNRLFKLIEELLDWDNIFKNQSSILSRAKKEILLSSNGKLPLFWDPFSGGGSIPLEAKRLGLETYSSDINPIAVIIGKSLLELPSGFSDIQPVNSNYRLENEIKKGLSNFQGFKGLAEDIKHYGNLIFNKAKEEIGYLYPNVELEINNIKKQFNVIAWLWTRIVPSPNPSLKGTYVPLISTFELSRKQQIFLKVNINKKNMTYDFTINKEGMNNLDEGTIKSNGGRCLISDTPITLNYLKEQGKNGNIKHRLKAIILEGEKGKIYIPPIKQHETIIKDLIPNISFDEKLSNHPQYMGCPRYGLDTFDKLFTNRQLVALNTFSELISDTRELIYKDSLLAFNNDTLKAKLYSNLITTYLSIAFDKAADYWSSLCTWHVGRETIRNTFSRQALPMVWDFAETNPFSDSTGNWNGCIRWICKVVENLPKDTKAYCNLRDATEKNELKDVIISTDPPYFDNVPYGDLSDFFYVWLRKNLKDIYPDIFSTVLVPKMNEIIADRYRYGSKEEASKIFLERMQTALNNMLSICSEDYPMTIYYAFKQSESTEFSSTGWETFLEALINAGFQIEGTFPIHSELSNRTRGLKSNALSSSILLVCRKRLKNAKVITRGDFLRILREELPQSIKIFHETNIPPVDLVQTCIGPGMSIFTKHSKVLEADGTVMPVKTALQLINQVLDEYLSKNESSYDSYTRFAITWFEQYGIEAGPYGDAETIAKAKNISVNGAVEAGIIESKSGKVRLLKREELQLDWDPYKDKRLTIWESTQYLIRELQNNGEIGAAALLYKLGSKGELARDLAYRLYDMCDRKKWAEEALSYNSLVIAWPNIVQLTSDLKGSEQIKLNV